MSRQSLKPFLASLHHAVWTRKMVDIAGSYFTHNELEEPLRMLEASTDLLASAQALLDALDRDLPHNMKHHAAGERFNLRAAIAKATGGTNE